MALMRTRRNLPTWPWYNDPFRMLESDLPSVFRRPEASRGWLPAVDVSETSDGLTFTAEVPGFDRESLDISVEDRTLTISGERRHESEEGEGKQFHRVERSYGRFERSFTLPTNVDAANVDANLRDGVLTIFVPKREEAKPRQIEVKA